MITRAKMSTFDKQEFPKVKRPIDRIRESGGRMDIGTPDDETPITGLLPIGDTLFVIKEKGIYEIRFADAVDPQ